MDYWRQLEVLTEILIKRLDFVNPLKLVISRFLCQSMENIFHANLAGVFGQNKVEINRLS